MGAEDDVGPRPALRGPQGRPLLRRAAAPRCPRTRSPQGYQDVEDPSVYVTLPGARRRRRPAARRQAPRLDDDAVDAALQRRAGRRRPTSPTCAPRTATCSPRRASRRVLGEDARGSPIASTARDMLGARYEPPFPFIASRGVRRARATPSLPADFVSAEDGTGIVHTAIAFGEDDFRLGAEQGLAVVNPVQPRRHLRRAHRARSRAAGSRTPTPTSSRTCARAGGCSSEEAYLHAYPHCWRCGTPLLYYAKPSWYIRTSSLRDRLLAANETVDWYPEHIKHGRFGQVAGEQRRLGDLARALLGHAAADLAQRGGRDDGDRIARRARAAQRRAARRPAPPVRRRRRDPLRRPAASRCAACPR